MTESIQISRSFEQARKKMDPREARYWERFLEREYGIPVPSYTDENQDIKEVKDGNTSTRTETA